MIKTSDKVEEDNIDLRTLFRLFLRRKWWFFATVIVVAALGLFYISKTPVWYEARYKFSLEDKYSQGNYFQYKDLQDEFTLNQDVFIKTRDIPDMFKTDSIFMALEDIPDIDNYKPYVDSSLIKIDLDNQNSIFSLRVKNVDKKLAKDIGRKLIESLGIWIKEKDIEIFENTITMIDDDKLELEEENNYFAEKIDNINIEINDIHSELKEHDIMEKKGEIFIYRERIINNEYEIKKLNDLYLYLSDEKSNVENRIELLTEEPSYSIENNRMINIAVVILLSLLSGILVVIFVNYIDKLVKSGKNVK